MNRSRLTTQLLRAVAVGTVLLGSTSCGGSGPNPRVTKPGQRGGLDAMIEATSKQVPPNPGPARDVSFPPVARVELSNGLELNTVEWHQLPVVYLQLVIRSGAEADPTDKAGLAHLVAQMLKEGTRTRTSAALAEEVDFLGADLHVASDRENSFVQMRCLSDQLDAALAIVADVTMNPVFRAGEFKKLRRRELDRLSLRNNDPNFLARRELYRALYGDHPYARIDTTREVLERVTRGDLHRWHRKHYVPNNAFLVATGDVTPERLQAAVTKAFGRWRKGNVPEPDYAEAPAREKREVILVDRPESVQSVIAIGNLALERSSTDYIPLRVANQVLGGSAASRLFMDLRERRSLTYGAYSQVGEALQVAPFSAWASVRNEVTGDAMDAFFEHLGRITTDAPPEHELKDARRFLSDRFPLQIDTPGKIAQLVGELRIYGLPDDYWDTYRSSLGKVSSTESLAAAQRYVQPNRALVVVVGRAVDLVEKLRPWGPVTVLSTEGEVRERFDPVESAEAS